MSFFLEDDNTVVYDEYILNQSINNILDECNDFSLGIALNEISYNNIFINLLNEEYHLLLEAGTDGVSTEKFNANRNFIDKIINFFKELGRKLINFISSVISKLTNISGMMMSFVAMNKKKILEGASKGDITCSLNAWKNQLADVNEISVITNKIKVNNTNYTTIEESFNNSLKEIIDEEKGKVTVNINTGLATKSIKNISLCKSSIESIKRTLDDTQRNYKKAESVASRGKTVANNGEEFEKIKSEIDVYKSMCQTSERMNKKVLSILTKLLKDSHTVNKTCLSAGKKLESERKQSKKTEKTIKKSEKKIIKNQKIINKNSSNTNP